MSNPWDKPNYSALFKENLSTPVTYSEDNSIPIYDLNFNFLETIDLKTESDVLNFINDNKLNAISR